MTKMFTIHVTPLTLKPRDTGKVPTGSINERELVRSGDTIVFARVEGTKLRLTFEKELFGYTDEVNLDDTTTEVQLVVQANPGPGKTKTYKLDLQDVSAGQATPDAGKSFKGEPTAEKGTIVVVGGNGPVPDPDKK